VVSAEVREWTVPILIWEKGSEVVGAEVREWTVPSLIWEKGREVVNMGNREWTIVSELKGNIKELRVKKIGRGKPRPNKRFF